MPLQFRARQPAKKRRALTHRSDGGDGGDGSDDGESVQSALRRRQEAYHMRSDATALSAKKEIAMTGFAHYDCVKILSIRRTFDAC